MNERNIFNVLKQDIEIPEIVQNKADIAFEQIMNEQKANMPVPVPKKKRKRYNRIKIAVAILVATTILGTVTVCAEIYKKWSKGLEKELHIEETDKIVAETTELVQFQNISVEDAGIKITAQQSLVDNYTAFLSFKVEGFDIEKYDEPGFGSVSVDVEGETVNAYYDFYDNLIAGDHGGIVQSDGSEVPKDENGKMLISHIMEDGSLEYRILLMEFRGEKGSFFGKTIHVQFEDLGIITQKAGPVEIQLNGNWEFEWELQGSRSTYEKELHAELGDTGATVKHIELSPISLKVIYDFEKTVTSYFISEYGEEYNIPIYSEPPRLLGVKLKDGRLLSGLNMGGGLDGFINEHEYTICFMTDRILNVDEIEALLFKNDETFDTGVECTEDMFYVVNIR